jgi:hypothetical protein
MECPELIIWMSVRDIALTQRDSALLQMAMQNIDLYMKGLKSKDWNYKLANSSKIPYKDI